MKYFLTLCITVLLLAGCQEKTPEGMPSLIKSASISVIQDGKPLEAAKVSLFAEDAELKKWTVSGKTDSAGNAKLVTHGQYTGAPAGKYRVTVTKREEPNFKLKEPTPGMTDDEFKAARAAENVTAHQLVDQKFGKQDSTTLNIEISSTSPSGSVDVGTSIRIPIIESK